MSKHKNFNKFNESESFEADKFEMMDDSEMYMDRTSAKDRGNGRDARRAKKQAERNKRDRYLDEMYGY